MLNNEWSATVGVVGFYVESFFKQRNIFNKNNCSHLDTSKNRFSQLCLQLMVVKIFYLLIRMINGFLTFNSLWGRKSLKFKFQLLFRRRNNIEGKFLMKKVFPQVAREKEYFNERRKFMEVSFINWNDDNGGTFSVVYLLVLMSYEIWEVSTLRLFSKLCQDV